MQGSIDEFKRGGYKYVITSSGALPSSWLHYKTCAEFAAATLAALGLGTNRIVVLVPPAESTYGRTYSSALAVRNWLESTSNSVRAVNVFSFGAHARRSRLIFQKVLGDKVKVGVLAHPNDSYTPNRWWASMDGFCVVTEQAALYLYVRIFFHPHESTTGR